MLRLHHATLLLYVISAYLVILIFYLNHAIDLFNAVDVVCVCVYQFYAMDALHKNDYDLSKALVSLVPASGPVLCRDQMEEWSASEANLFEEALEKYGKDFNDIRTDFVSVSLMSAYCFFRNLLFSSWKLAGMCSLSMINTCLLCVVAMEVDEGHGGILLYVEDY